MTIKQILAQLGGVFPMDDAIIEALPPGRTFLSVTHSATSAWTITGKVTALNPLQAEEYYFVKIAYGETGRIMLRGEYESSQIIHQTTPDFIPQPIHYGQYHHPKDGPALQTYFYLSAFVDMDVTAPPNPAEFTARLARLHRLSASPTGQFGFAVPTCDGDRAHVVDWQASWAEFYRNLFLGVCRLDLARNGAWPAYERVMEAVVRVVIPRLLGPLQAGGRVLKPCLVHGDLWEGNVGVRRGDGRSVVFDAGSYFAHNEMELGHWKCEFSTVFRDEAYIDEYVKHYPKAEPQEEFYDRVRLYSLKGAINYSAGHPNSELRKTAYNNMLYLCEKYAPVEGVDRYGPAVDPWLTGASIVPHMADGLI
ncbi:Fructosamine kinase-domain-containing protein [Chaetomium sp. MPI-SDFR-AT-0129]|nr:Fructosamine kinase-domain-containing protein [Chaetomium sp. MPI-SDFR-AT-0129]